MSIKLECTDGHIDIDEDKIRHWSIKDLTQEGVLSLPYTINEILDLFDYEKEKLFVYYTKRFEIYKITHFIGHETLLHHFRDHAIKESNLEFFVLYMAEWNIGELEKINPGRFVNKNMNILPIMKFFINQGKIYLKPIYFKWLMACDLKFDENVHMNIGIYVDTLSDYTKFVYQELINNRLYMDKYQKLVEHDLEADDLSEGYLTTRKLSGSENVFLSYARDTNLEKLPEIILNEQKVVKVYNKNREHVYLYRVNDMLYEVKMYPDMKYERVYWKDLFEYNNLSDRVLDMKIDLNKIVKGAIGNMDIFAN